VCACVVLKEKLKTAKSCDFRRFFSGHTHKVPRTCAHDVMFTKTMQCRGDQCTRWIDGVSTNVGAVYCTTCVAQIDVDVSKNYGCSQCHDIIVVADADDAADAVAARLPKHVASVVCKPCIIKVDKARLRLSDEAHDRWLKCNDDDGWSTVWTTSTSTSVPPQSQSQSQ